MFKYNAPLKSSKRVDLVNIQREPLTLFGHYFSISTSEQIKWWWVTPMSKLTWQGHCDLFLVGQHCRSAPCHRPHKFLPQDEWGTLSLLASVPLKQSARFENFHIMTCLEITFFGTQRDTFLDGEGGRCHSLSSMKVKTSYKQAEHFCS